MLRRLSLPLILAALSACPGPPVVTRFRVEGKVTGLEGSGLGLMLNGTELLPIRIPGDFSFDTPIANGQPYVVTVSSQPTSPAQLCQVARGTGTVSGANVVDIEVTCVTQSFALGGTVTGLTGTGLVLRNNGGDDLPIAANGPFRFATPVRSGATYTVSVATQPRQPTQSCVIQSGFGVMGAAEVLDLQVFCMTNPVTIGGRITGLTGTGLVLQNNGTADLAVQPGATSYSFTVPRDAAYTISVKTQPTAPNQTCTLVNAGGTTTTVDVTNIDLTCVTDLFPVGGTVTGLTGSGLVLHNSDGTDLPVVAGATSYNFNLPSGSAYSLTVLSQPVNPSQVCTLVNASGTVSTSVTNAHLTCVTSSFTVGGTITGLAGSGLVLQNNGAGNLTLPSGSTTYSFTVASGGPYAVSVLTQPSNPTQTCVVSNASGTVTTANVTNVSITCSATTFTVGGTITGLSGSGLVLQNNLGPDLPIAASATSYAFTVPSSTGYAITVKTQPTSPTQVCTVSNSSGTVTNVNVTNATINCVTTSFNIGGTVTGLVGSGLVLQNNLGSDLPVSGASYSFSAPSGSAYSVTVRTQPTNPTQVCTVSNPTGTVPNGPVTNIGVTCTCSPYCPQVLVLAGTTSPTANHLVGRFAPGGSWVTSRLSGVTQSGTGLALLDDGTAVGLVRNSGDDLLKYTRFTGSWSALANLATGVTTRSRPSLGGGATAQAVFQGLDFKHYTANFNGSWGAVSPVGVRSPQAQVFGPSAPVMLPRGPGAFTVAYIEDTTNVAKTVDFAATLWQFSVNVSGGVTDYFISPSIVGPTSGPAMLMTWLSGSQFRYATSTAGTWSAAADITNAFAVDPAALVALPGGEVLMLFRGTDAKLYALSYNGTSWGLPSLPLAGGVTIVGAPSLAKGQGGALAELAYVGTDGAAYHLRLDASRTWSAPVQIGTSVDFVSIVSGP